MNIEELKKKRIIDLTAEEFCAVIFEMQEKSKPVAVESENKKDIIDMDEAAKMLGLSKPTLYGKTAAKIIPHYKQGKKNYFVRSELEQWLLGNKILSIDEINAVADAYISRKR